MWLLLANAGLVLILLLMGLFIYCKKASSIMGFHIFQSSRFNLSPPQQPVWCWRICFIDIFFPYQFTFEITTYTYRTYLCVCNHWFFIDSSGGKRVEIIIQLLSRVLVHYHIRANRPPVVYKYFTVSRWLSIEIFPNFCPKNPKKLTFEGKKW